MAIVTEIKHQALERESRHTEVECTYDVIEADGKKFLQLGLHKEKSRVRRAKASGSRQRPLHI